MDVTLSSRRSERVPHADGGAPVFIKGRAFGAFDIGPEVGGGRQVQVGANAVFNPGVLAVRFDRRAVCAGDLAVARKLMDSGNAQVDVALVVRTLHAGGKAHAAHEAVHGIERVGGRAEVKVVLVDVGPRQFALGLDVELLGEVVAPVDTVKLWSLTMILWQMSSLASLHE